MATKKTTKTKKAKKTKKAAGTAGKEPLAPLGWIDANTPIGRRFEFEGQEGDFDPRIRGKAKAAFEFSLVLTTYDPNVVTMSNDDDPADTFTFNISAEHWREVYAPACCSYTDGHAGENETAGKDDDTPTPAENPKSEISNPKSARQGGASRSPAIPNPKLPPRADLVLVPIDAIEVHKNARSTMDEGQLLELADSLKSIGLLEPVIVRKVGKKFVMIAGHRRLKAAVRNGETLIEAKVYGEISDGLAARMQLTENLKREDLNHVDIARQLGAARDAGMTHAQIAAEISASDDYVRKHLDLLRLGEPVLQLVASGRLPVKQAELIARVGDKERQIALARDTTRLRWDSPKKIWRPRLEGREKGEQGVDDRDFVCPVDDLREYVSSAMLGLAGCGWPMGEEYAGRRACVDCPDNSVSYAHQPTLFAGFNPRGSDKKGHCTNESCYRTKERAWAKVRAERKKEQQKKMTAKIAKAKAAGLDVCDDCGKVADAGVEFKKSKDCDSKLCPKCIKKAEKRASQDGGYAEQQKQREEMEKKFPWTAEQRFAVATYEYGEAVAAKIAEVLNRRRLIGEGEVMVQILGCFDPSIYFNSSEKKLAGGLKNFLPETCVNREIMVSLFGQLVNISQYKPCVGYDVEVEDVPLDDDCVELIDFLEALAGYWNIGDLPARPTQKGVEAEFAEKQAEAERDATVKIIVKGKRLEAKAAIAACEDADLLTYLLMPKAVNGITKVATWRVNAINARIDELKKSKASQEPKMPAPPGDTREQQFVFVSTNAGAWVLMVEPTEDTDAASFEGRTTYGVLLRVEDAAVAPATESDIQKWRDEHYAHLLNRIIQGRKATALDTIKKTDWLPAATMKSLLQKARDLGLKGDWRRAAVHTRIKKLEKEI